LRITLLKGYKIMKVENIALIEDLPLLADTEKMEKVAYILKAIAHPLRIGIIGILMKNEKMCVNDICQTLGSEQSLTSHHLSNMKLNGVLGSSRVGKNIYYHLRLKEVINIIHCMNKCDII
jgi:DNA-binding transcriptional ArsR family regulator